MIRPFLATSLIVLSTPAFSDTFTTEARVDTVTIYPGLATVTRQITLDLPQGRHDIIVPGLPEDLASEGLRLAASEGAQIGAVNLAYDRLPVTPDMTRPEVQEAQNEVERLEAVLRERTANIAAIRLRAQAAQEQITFLQSLSQSNAGENISVMPVDDIQALARMVGAETLRIKQEAFAAEEEAKAAERAREDDIDALDEAKRALAAIVTPEQEGSVLTFTLAVAEAGEVTVEFSALEGYANWSPVYDIRLSTKGAPNVNIERSVVVSQRTGQDWLDVNLILSTARPGERIAPSGVIAPLRRIVSEEELEQERSKVLMRDSLVEAPAVMGAAADDLAAPEVQAFQATANFSGASVTYTYPGRVDIRNGVEDLRLPLDQLSMDAAVWAEAVPSRDSVAYRMAEFTNESGELLLPGQALLFADGTMIGFSNMPLLAASAETKMGFGPLDGLMLSRAVPRRSEGDVGVFSSSNQLEEAAIMTIENVTEQDWRILLRDVVPYSEQEDLTVEYTAQPDVTIEAPEGQRGVLEWDLDVAAGQTEAVRLDYKLTWPDGFVLR